MEKLRVGLLFGGWSFESYLCAHPTLEKTLAELGHDVVPIQTADTSLAQRLIDENLDVAFLASHGFYHEDGRLQSICDWIDLPYTGPNHFVSALCMNKIQFKSVADRFSDKPLPYVVLRKNAYQPDFSELRAQLGTSNLILKPALSGASVGIRSVRSETEYENVLPQTLTRYGETIVEPLLSDFRELSVTVHDFDGRTQALDVCELLTGGEVFDFDMKNGFKTIQKQLPAEIPNKTTQKLKNMAVALYEDIGLEGIIRVDVLLDSQKNLHVLEVNTLPGLMPQSVAPAAANARGIGYHELIQQILLTALKEKRFCISKQTSGQPRLSDSVSL